jgi:hypothetical protein
MSVLCILLQRTLMLSVMVNMEQCSMIAFMCKLSTANCRQASVGALEKAERGAPFLTPTQRELQHIKRSEGDHTRFRGANRNAEYEDSTLKFQRCSKMQHCVHIWTKFPAGQSCVHF